MRLEIDIAEHHYNNIMALDSVSLGRVPYKGIIMYSINAIKHGKVLEQEPRWISVNEKLPEIQNYSDSYLVTLKRGGVHIAMFTECDGKHWWTYDDVVAWMPLPKPFEPQESEG